MRFLKHRQQHIDSLVVATEDIPAAIPMTMKLDNMLFNILFTNYILSSIHSCIMYIQRVSGPVIVG